MTDGFQATTSSLGIRRSARVTKQALQYNGMDDGRKVRDREKDLIRWDSSKADIERGRYDARPQNSKQRATKGHPLARKYLKAIERWEGFVLKGCDAPCFSFNGTISFIKLKKDYIPGVGDTADLVVVGGRRDMRDEGELGIGKLWWTSFYIGCLENKDEVCRFDAKPRFCIIDVIDRYGISKEDMLYLSRHGYFERVPFARSISEFDVSFEHGRQLQLADLFQRPFPAELMGAGFDKPFNSQYFTLRFPRVLKIHNDRLFKDTVNFEEL